MAGRDENRIFVGGLAWETTEKQLEDAFTRYGKILESLVCLCFSFLSFFFFLNIIIVSLWNLGFCIITVLPFLKAQLDLFFFLVAYMVVVGDIRARFGL